MKCKVSLHSLPHSYWHHVRQYHPNTSQGFHFQFQPILKSNLYSTIIKLTLTQNLNGDLDNVKVT